MLNRFRPRSLRIRLTLWYSCALVFLALILIGASRWAMAISLNHALDQGLRHELIGLRAFMDENSEEGPDQLARKLRSLNHLGELFQVFGPQGELLAQSDGLAGHDVDTQRPPDPGTGILFRSAATRRFRMRMATQKVYVGGEKFTIEAGDPERKFHGVLHEFDSVLWVAVPLALVIAVLGGYWLSRRALTPVDRIIEEARAIHPGNLAARLSVPPSRDELQRLSETLNEMLARVERSFLQVRQFTADASHELRAPLTLIYTAAQLSLRRERSVHELKDSLQRILHAAQRCTELINQLLTLARSDAAGSSIELVATDLASLVVDVVNEATVIAREKGLNVSASVPENAIVAAVDQVSFRRMLLILLDNAIKYTALGGSIAVRFMEEADEVAIVVSDTGAGIAEGDLPFIFDRFWRADKVRTRDAGGTGLGLAIARDIAKSHQAELNVESVLGQGSMFTIRLARDARKPLSEQVSTEQPV